MFWLVLAAACPYVWAIGVFRRPHLKLTSMDVDELKGPVPPGLDVLTSFVLIQAATTAFLTVFAARRPEMQQTVEALVTLSAIGLLVVSLFGYWLSRSVLAAAGIFYGLVAVACLGVYWMTLP